MKLEFNLTFDDLLNATGGQPVIVGERLVFDEIFTDSRENYCSNSVFFALKGERFNAEDFVPGVFQKGASCAVVSWDFLETNDISKYRGKTIIAVSNVVSAYGALAEKYLNFFKLKKKIAITGSSGKTTTKEMVYKILSENFGEKKVLKNQSNFNNQIGIPKTIFGLNKDHDFIVLELGTNIKGEINKLSSIIKPDIAAIINIGKSHLLEFKTLEGVLEEKFSIVSNIKEGAFFILNLDDPLLFGIYKKTVNGINFLSFGSKNADITFNDIKIVNGRTEFNVIFKEKEYPVKIKALGLHFVYDFICALLICWTCGVDINSGINSIKDFNLPRGRMETIAQYPDGSILIDDSYNSNPDSLKAAFDTIINSYSDKKKILVLGDMLELGHSSEVEHFNAAKFAAKFADYIFYTGNYDKYIIDGLKQSGFNLNNVILFNDKKSFQKKFSGIDKKNSVILIKGSRGMRMEEYFEGYHDI
jgi:UDP-N-acetylmuramoyl-tripeptide--D-alanyl-D-alanine ligase